VDAVLELTAANLSTSSAIDRFASKVNHMISYQEELDFITEKMDIPRGGRVSLLNTTE
jgi:hypothetical protein